MLSRPPVDPSRAATLLQIAPVIRGALARDSGIDGKPRRVVLAALDDAGDAGLTLASTAPDQIFDALQATDTVSQITFPELGTFGVGASYAEASGLGTVRKTGDLTGQVAIVTGGAGGLGLSVAELLRDQGAEVALMDIAEGPVTAAAESLGGIGIVCDVTDPVSVDAAVAQVVAHYGGIDILVSNAGAALQGSLLDLDDAAFQKAFALNFWGHHYIARAVVRVMKVQKTGGALVFNVSKQAVNPGPDFGAYGTPKAALMALMRQYAVEHGADQITSNAVNADRIRTGLMTDQMVAERSKARGLTPDQYMRGNLLKREVTGRDVAEAFVHLAKARTTTGAVLTVDGGNVAAMMR